LDAGLGSYNEILKNNKKVGDVVDKYTNKQSISFLI